MCYNGSRIYMMRKAVCILIVSSLVFNGCATEKNIKYEGKENVTMSPTDSLEEGQADEQTYVSPTEYPEEKRMTTDINWNAITVSYWNKQLKMWKDNIDYIIEWFKKADYCKVLRFHQGNPRPFTDDQAVEKRIQKEKNYNRVKEIMSGLNYIVHNNWGEEKEIVILHRFDIGEVAGNYVLIYKEGTLTEAEKHYQKLDENYYCKIIFYE